MTVFLTRSSRFPTDGAAIPRRSPEPTAPSRKIKVSLHFHPARNPGTVEQYPRQIRPLRCGTVKLKPDEPQIADVSIGYRGRHRSRDRGARESKRRSGVISGCVRIVIGVSSPVVHPSTTTGTVSKHVHRCCIRRSRATPARQPDPSSPGGDYLLPRREPRQPSRTRSNLDDRSRVISGGISPVAVMTSQTQKPGQDRRYADLGPGAIDQTLAREEFIPPPFGECRDA